MLDSPSLPAPGPGGLSRARFHPLVFPFSVGSSESHGESSAGKLRHEWGCRFMSPPPRGLGTRWASRRKEAAGWRGVRIPAGSREEMGWTGRGGGGGPVPGGPPRPPAAAPGAGQRHGDSPGHCEQPWGKGYPGDLWRRAGGPFCPAGVLGGVCLRGLESPLPCVPWPRWQWEPQDPGCVLHAAARPRGGCTGKEGAPSAPPAGSSSESPTLLAPAAHFGEMEAASQYVGGKTLGPSCSRSFEHTQI